MYIYRVVFLAGPHLFSNKMKKAYGPIRGLSDEGVHGTAASVGSLAIFRFSTKQGGPVEKITLYID